MLDSTRGLSRIFFKITKPLCQLLQHDVPYVFSQECMHAFNLLKKPLISAPRVKTHDWTKPFELMCDASDFLQLDLC